MYHDDELGVGWRGIGVAWGYHRTASGGHALAHLSKSTYGSSKPPGSNVELPHT